MPGDFEAYQSAGSDGPTVELRKKKEKVKKPLWKEILEWVLTIVIAVAAALVIRSFIFEPVKVDGHSMDDTLSDGEIMLVSKYDYGSVWLTFPWQDDGEKETATRFAVGTKEPERFDVVICRYPGRGDTNFVKRIVGIPGDELYIEDGYLYVNGEKQPEEYVSDGYRVRGGSNGWSFCSAEEPYKVPERHYFVMGDHRNNSNDSRAHGAIEREMIVGHVRRVVFPFGGWRGIR